MLFPLKTEWFGNFFNRVKFVGKCFVKKNPPLFMETAPGAPPTPLPPKKKKRKRKPTNQVNKKQPNSFN